MRGLLWRPMQRNMHRAQPRAISFQGLGHWGDWKGAKRRAWRAPTCGSGRRFWPSLDTQIATQQALHRCPPVER